MTALNRTIGFARETFASAAYTAASFVASLVSVVIISANLPTYERAGLFLFIALYSPLTTVMSQRKLLSIYQNRASDGRWTVIEEMVLLAATAAIVSLATRHYYGPLEATVLASTVLCQIQSATTAGSIQHRTNNALGWSMAVLATAAVRISATWLTSDYGPVVAFAAGSYGYLLATLALQALTQRIAEKRLVNGSKVAAEEHSTLVAWHKRLATFVFFSVGAVTFQMDKYALDGAGRAAAVAESGAVTVLLLSPISLLFATLYRTRTKTLFSTELLLSAKMPTVCVIAAQFTAGTALYVILLLAPWPGFTAMAFPFVQAPVASYLVLALAIVVDRFGTLLAFAAGDWRIFLGIAAFKAAALMLVYCGVRYWMGSQTLTAIYLAYLAAGLACLFLAAALPKWFKGHHAQI